MKPLDRYGPALIEYEGVADLTFPQESGLVYKGYFEAKQLTGGGIAIGFAPIAHDSGGSTIITGRFNSEPQFHGRDPDDWELTTCGQTLFAPIIGPLGAPKSAAHPACVFSSQGIRAKSKRASESGYDQARFRVSNFLWHYREEIPEPITLKIGVLAVTISPGDYYLETAANIKAVRGIAPTAEVLIKTSDDSKLSLESYSHFMNNLVSVFRLVTGNRVDWYYGEAFEVGTERPVERFHKDAVTGPFSNTIRFRRLSSGMTRVVRELTFNALAESYLGNGGQVLDPDILKELIDYFINACDETSYLEARGLLASTLLDLIVLKYARTKEAHTVMEEKEYRKQVLPAFKKAITNVELPKSSNELRRRAKEELVGAYRTSFRKRLELLAERLDIPLSKNDCSRAVKIRNELVHEGRYLSANGDDDWYSQYRLMIWIDLVALCRLTGYDGDLPLLVTGQRLTV